MIVAINQVQTWYERAQIDYIDKYMALYAAFNAWYSQTLNVKNDRQALNILRRGIGIWQDYSNGHIMRDIAQYMELLVEYTQREPLSYSTPHWRGEVAHSKDWQSLLEYWYRVRCLVMHGAEIQTMYVYLAYQTLNIFMGEIVKRAHD